MTDFKLHHGDCLDVLRTMPDNSIDAIVTDPPYGLSDHKPAEVTACLSAWIAGEIYQPKGKGFMSIHWDAWVPGPEVWRECLRVLKPGGHMLAFAGTRSMDLMSMAIRLAGFELRDSIGNAHDDGGAPLLAWTFGSGFPKSLDVSKAIDKKLGAEREVVGQETKARSTSGASALPTVGGETVYKTWDITAPATEAAKQWEGWGSALKPSFEPLILAQKPFRAVPNFDIIASINYQLGLLSWLLLSSAENAETILALSPQELEKEPPFVAMNVALIHGLQSGELLEKMDTLASQETVLTSLSIAILWSGILAAISQQQSTFTTETAIEVTTGLKILNSLLSTSMPEYITQEEINLHGSTSHAKNAESNLTDEKERQTDTRKLFAAEIATLRTAVNGTNASNAARILTPITHSAFSALKNVTQAIAKHYPNQSSLNSVLNAGPQNLGMSFIQQDANARIVYEALTISEKEKSGGLSPKFDPILLCRKPLTGTIADNVLEWGTGALNIDATRIPTSDKLGGGSNSASADYTGKHEGWKRPWMEDADAVSEMAKRSQASTARSEELGRWPANFCHDGSQAVLDLFPSDKQGSAARYFYCAKASRADREEGVRDVEYKLKDDAPDWVKYEVERQLTQHS